jgi:4-hydroxybenzoyl-CoA thioesterase
MAFTYEQLVLFKHCDPAGIVFYPRYFEMMNDCTEAFFAGPVGWPFHEMHRDGSAVPTAEIKTRFTRPSHHGDRLILTLAVERVGRSSLGIHITAKSGEETRFISHSTLVLVDGEGRPKPWTQEQRNLLLDLKDGIEP